MSLLEQVPNVAAPLDPDFRPAALGHRAFARRVAGSDGEVVLDVALERDLGQVTRARIALSPFQGDAALNQRFSERWLKFLLWQHGAWRLHLSGPEEVTRYLERAYGPAGMREFDAEFMAQVYRRPRFEVLTRRVEELPPAFAVERRLGRHLDGCRIGFDAGGSDRKVVALIDGRQVFAAETPWQPKLEADPRYHYDGIRDSMRQALPHLPRLDGIGVSSAGIFVDGETRVASLFRKVPADLFETRIRRIYLEIAEEFAVPVAVANDGDVAALAGSMELNDAPVLGLALGTSLAAGYVNAAGAITGQLNELAFAPLDYSARAVCDEEWSNDLGVGVNYLSQDAAIRLAAPAGIQLSPSASPAEKLAELQRKHAAGDERAGAVFETLGAYLGYAVLLYSDFYTLKHVLVMGRVLSGSAGEAILQIARRVLQCEAPELARDVTLGVAEESARRIGQSLAAASLVDLNRGHRNDV
ncbi:MAG TPA: hypothetical protein VFU02_04670 [Polyangiaceae bacterium]|nr:hypothetical protein [Polyangiaceae bacterium]